MFMESDGINFVYINSVDREELIELTQIYFA